MAKINPTSEVYKTMERKEPEINQRKTNRGSKKETQARQSNEIKHKHQFNFDKRRDPSIMY